MKKPLQSYALRLQQRKRYQPGQVVSPEVNIVVPVYNEAESIQLFHQALVSTLETQPDAFTIIYVNDGSRDNSQEILQTIALQDERVMVVEFSRNFGHQSALSAGIGLAEGDYVITLDSDGEHPPEVIPRLLDLARQGYDIVTTQRADQKELGVFKRYSSRLFYRLINRLSSTQIEPDAADFRLMNRKAVQALRSLPEYHRFLRGMVSWLGFRTASIPYSPATRIAGRSKYSLRKMLGLALDALFSFSLIPLYSILSIGCAFLALALVEVIYVLSFWVRGQASHLTPGWASLMFILLFVGGSILTTLGIIGIYVGYILQEVQRRPVYLIKSVFQKQTPDRA